MNAYVTGNTIKKLREKNNLTQQQLADSIMVSAKTVSKWETGNGFPDAGVIEDIARVLNVSVSELFSGDVLENTNEHANMLNTKFYVCPICGNVIHSIGEVYVSCHGIDLTPLEPEECNISYENVEDEIFVQIDNHMTKDNYISFIAGVSPDSVELKKLYKEGPCETRLKCRALRYIYYYSNRNGLFRCIYKRKKNN